MLAVVMAKILEKLPSKTAHVVAIKLAFRIRQCVERALATVSYTLPHAWIVWVCAVVNVSHCFAFCQRYLRAVLRPVMCRIHSL